MQKRGGFHEQVLLMIAVEKVTAREKKHDINDYHADRPDSDEYPSSSNDIIMLWRIVAANREVPVEKCKLLIF